MLSSDEAFQLLLIYTPRSSQSHAAMGHQVKVLVDERESVIPGRPTLSLHEAPQPVTAPRARPVISPSRCPTWSLVTAATTDAFAGEQAKRDLKTQALFPFAVGHLKDLAE